MNSKRLIYFALTVTTLSIGIFIGSIVSGGVKATSVQKPAVLIIPDPVSMSNSFSQVAEQLSPAVVNIEVQVPRPPSALGGRGGNGRGGGGNRGGRGGNGGNGGNAVPPLDELPGLGAPPQAAPELMPATGTGFIVDKAGFIVTNEHVVKGATKITVMLSDKTKYEARLIGTDNYTDLAVIKIEAGKDLPVAKFGNSDAVKTGDWVLAVGSPFGFDHTVTSGIISAKGRSSDELRGGGGPPTNSDGFQSFLQTDAAINPGNSGGPLLNMAGEVIGINTAIVSETNSFAGLGFALPSNIAINVYNQIAQTGKMTRGSIGINYSSDAAQNLETLLAFGLKEGIVVQDVVPGMPAAQAGLKYGDVITAIDGQKITSGPMLLDIIASSPVDKSVQMKIVRNGREQAIPVQIVDRVKLPGGEPESAANSKPASVSVPALPAERVLGITVQAVPQNIVRDHGLSGVAISSILRGSVGADVLGERPAGGNNSARPLVIDAIIVDGVSTEIRTTADYDRVIASLKRGTRIAFGMFVPDPRESRLKYDHKFMPLMIP